MKKQYIVAYGVPGYAPILTKDIFNTKEEAERYIEDFLNENKDKEYSKSLDTLFIMERYTRA